MRKPHMGMGPLQANCHHGLGVLSLKLGQPEQAGIALTTAIELYRAIDMTFWLPRVGRRWRRRDEIASQPWML